MTDIVTRLNDKTRLRAVHGLTGWVLHEEALRAEAAAEIERLRAWHDTVDDMLTVCHEVASDDPRESINRLINWNVSVALDPDVSSDAAALVMRGRVQTQDVLMNERDQARASRDRAVSLLAAIHGLLYPSPLTTGDGRTMVFRPENPHEFMQALSDRIRALPDEIERLEKT